MAPGVVAALVSSLTLDTGSHIAYLRHLLSYGTREVAPLSERYRSAMDIFELLLDHRMVVCKLCETGIYPSVLPKHIRNVHPRHASQPRRELAIFEKETLPYLLGQALVDPHHEEVMLPDGEPSPLPYLRIHDGFGCNHCPLVSKTVGVLDRHYNRTHAPVRRGRGALTGGTTRAARERLALLRYGETSPWRPVKFQRFFRSGPGSACFRVACPGQGSLGEALIEPKGLTVGDRSSSCVVDTVFQSLAVLEAQHAEGRFTSQRNLIPTQVSPWLERTRWATYLEGIRLLDAARLARPPDRTETILTEIQQCWKHGSSCTE